MINIFKERKTVEQVEEGNELAPKFDENGLMPVVTTDAKTGDVLMLGYMGAMPAEGIYLVLARVGTIYYFLHFIVVLPVVGLLEKTDPIPMSITEPVMSGATELSMAKKNDDKI